MQGNNLSGAQASFTRIHRLDPRTKLLLLAASFVMVLLPKSPLVATTPAEDAPSAITMLMLGAWSGVKHLSQRLLLKSDMVIRQLCNWDNFPSSPLAREIWRSKMFSNPSFLAKRPKCTNPALPVSLLSENSTRNGFTKKCL
jgi:hypothetical protein